MPRSSKSWLAGAAERAFAAIDVVDFRGQLRAERAYQVLIVGAAAVGFVHGFLRDSFDVTFYYWLAASLLAGLLTVPGWPWLYRRDPVKWLEALPAAEDADGDDDDEGGDDEGGSGAAAAAAAGAGGGGGAAAGGGSSGGGDAAGAKAAKGKAASATAEKPSAAR